MKRDEGLGLIVNIFWLIEIFSSGVEIFSGRVEKFSGGGGVVEKSFEGGGVRNSGGFRFFREGLRYFRRD